MGHVFVQAELSWTGVQAVRFLADTGATYTVIPSALAERLGLALSPQPINVTLADGSSPRMNFATVLVKVAEREAGVTVRKVRKLCSVSRHSKHSVWRWIPRLTN
jgi:predicted aspartyl protease